MFNWLQAFSKVMALFTAIKSDPALLAAIQDLASLFTQPAPTGGNPPQMLAMEAIPADKMEAVKSAFSNSTALHGVMRQDVSGEHKAAALDIGNLFNLFTQFLPQIIALINLLHPKKPATT